MHIMIDQPQKKMSAPRSRLLKVLLDPENHGKTITELSKLADIERSSYYLAMDDPDFRDAIKNKSIERIGAHLPEIFEACVKSAKQSTVAGMQDRKLLFSMIGVQGQNEVDLSQFSIGALLKEIAGNTKTIPKEDKNTNQGLQESVQNDIETGANSNQGLIDGE